MPAAVAAAVATAIAVVGTTAYAVAYAIVYAIVSIGMSYAVSALMGAIFKPNQPNTFTAEAQGRSQIVRSNVQIRNKIYGRVMTSGPLVFAASTSDGGKENRLMHLVVALADHECDAIEQVILGDTAVGDIGADGMVLNGTFVKRQRRSVTLQRPITAWPSITIGPLERVMQVNSVVYSYFLENGASVHTPTGDWGISPDGTTMNIGSLPVEATVITVTYETEDVYPLVRVKKHLGNINQEADGDLVNEVPGWTAAHRLRGICYLYIRLEYNADIFPSGLPNIKALVRGKRILDVRTGLTYWNQNWALCVYDYLTDPDGFGCAPSDIDTASVITAANISDEFVTLGDGSTQVRYECNGLVLSDSSPRENLTKMSTAGAGGVVLTGGTFRVWAGSFETPSVTLTEDDLRSSIKVQPRISRKDLFNSVKGTFVDPANFWQPNDFPVVYNPIYAQQDGESIDRDVEFPFTTNSVQAQRLAKIILERSRQGISVDFPAKISALSLSAYSTVYLTLAKFGWDAKPFMVMSWKLSAEGGVDLVLNEQAAEVYDWNYGNITVIDPAPDTNLPNPFLVESVGQITMESGTDQLLISQAGGVVSRIKVSWPPPTDELLSQTGRVELEYKRADLADWIVIQNMPASTTVYYITPVDDGYPYQVRARYLSSIGVRSQQWSYSPVHVVIGKQAPPADMTGFSLMVINSFAHLTWDVSTDADVKNGGQARIRYTSDTEHPTWGSAIDIGGFIAGSANSAQLPIMAGTYLGKWVDSTGHESVNEVLVITTAPNLQQLNIVANIQEDPDFAGVKESMMLDRDLGGIKLLNIGLIDDQGLSDATGVFDDMGLIDGLGLIDSVVGSGGWGLIDSLGGIVSEGAYYFDETFDLGVVEKSRLTAFISSVSFDTGDAIDDRWTLIDDWLTFDGDAVNDTTVSMFIRTTSDDPEDSGVVWSDWSSFAIGDYEARAFQFKIIVTSASPNHNVVVQQLRVTIDMPDRVESGVNILSGAGAYHVTFLKPFRILPVVGMTAQNMSQGDYWTITAKDEAGFTVNFYNSASVPVSRRFDWDAKAY